MDLLQKLNAVLKKELDCYQKLYKVAKEKKETLISSDSDKLLELINEDREIIEQIEKLEEERKKIIEKVKDKFGFDDENPTYTQIIKKLPEEWQEKLSSLRTDLLTLIEEFHIQNEENSSLLEQALELNKFSLDTILNKLDIDSGTYSKNNKKNSPRLLDKRG